jgi:epoxyqueuosine reductase QueG
MSKEFNSNTLDQAGLNLQAIFDLSSLPEKMLNELGSLYDDLARYKQILVIAHGGRDMWAKVQPTLNSSDHPIDRYSADIVTKFCETNSSISGHKLIYPSQAPVGLQSLGELAGWHHSSPFRIGINNQWGSWFAYRAVVLTDSHFKTTLKIEDPSPCLSCLEKPCISSCPADALEREFSLEKCLSYRKKPDSLCKDRCLARMTCPIAKEHQYEQEQINYHYGISMKMIEALGL